MNWHLELAAAMLREGGVEVSWKRLPESMDALVEILAEKKPGTWTPGSADWLERERSLIRAIPLRCTAAAPHYDFAKGIRHYFDGKVCRNRKSLEIWNNLLGRWTSCDQGETLLEQLRPVVSDALHAEATPLKLCVKHSAAAGKLVVEAVECWEPRYSSSAFVAGVSQFVAGLLPRPTKPLNGPSSRYVLVDRAGKLIDFELGQIRQATADDRISLCVPYSFDPWNPPDLAKDVVNKVARFYTNNEYSRCPAEDPEIVSMLEALLADSRVLRLLFPICSKDWSLTIYILLLMVGTVTGTTNME